ncbi:hypothetical protein GCM10020331_063320 [Ectobacillus funiculus]
MAKNCSDRVKKRNDTPYGVICRRDCMRTFFSKPIVVVSKCLEFDACRYNGDVISDPIVKKV